MFSIGRFMFDLMDCHEVPRNVEHSGFSNNMNRANATSTPILVTGMSRSGTTWTGTNLAMTPGVKLLYEPFNPDVRPRWGAFRLPHPLGIHRKFLFVDGGVAEKLERPVRRMLGSASRNGVRPLIKDPIAALAAPWLHDTFRARVVITLRHPAGVAASRLKLGWRFNFDHLLSQPRLVNGPLAPIGKDLKAFARARKKHDAVAESAWLWRAIYSFLMSEAQLRRDWIVVRHEGLCADPLTGFASLCNKLGLEFTAKVQQAVIRHSSGAADAENDLSPVQHRPIRNSSAVPDQWRNLISPQQVQRVREIVGELGEALYPESCW